jgi:hypothetical protein
MAVVGIQPPTTVTHGDARRHPRLEDAMLEHDPRTAEDPRERDDDPRDRDTRERDPIGRSVRSKVGPSNTTSRTSTDTSISQTFGLTSSTQTDTTSIET